MFDDSIYIYCWRFCIYILCRLTHKGGCFNNCTNSGNTMEKELMHYLTRIICSSGRPWSLGLLIQSGKVEPFGFKLSLEKNILISRQSCNSNPVCSIQIFIRTARFALIVSISTCSFAEQMESHDRHSISSDLDSVSFGRPQPWITS